MATKKKMTEDELLAIIEHEEENSEGLPGSELSDERAKAMEYYLGEKFGNEKTDRSSVVSTDVQDTVEWIMPSLMKVFAGGDAVVRFNPQNVEDIEEADQATDYTNYVFMRRNPGFQVLYNWFKDALIMRMGVVKAWWEEDFSEEREEYEGLTEPELQELISADDVEIMEMTELEGDDVPQVGLDGVPVPSVSTFDVAIKRTRDVSHVAVENIPPEEFLVTKRTKTVNDALLIGQRSSKTISQMVEMGFEVDDFEGVPTDTTAGAIQGAPEKEARYAKDEDSYDILVDNNSDESNRSVLVTEAYLRVDYDGDDIAELRKIIKVEGKILANDVVEDVPYYTLSPLPIPHKLVGMGIADTVMELQLIKSTIYRNILDNMYTQNNGRYEVLEGMVNLDDMLTSRPSGIVRVKTLGAVKRLDQPVLPQTSFDFLAVLDKAKEERTGVSSNTKGLNEGALASHTSGVAVNQVLSAAEQRVELIARVFAETGVKELFKGMYTLIIKNDKSESFVKLRNAFVQVQPSKWKDRVDMTVEVGIGNGNKDQNLAHLTQLGVTLGQIATQDPDHRLITAQNVFNYAAAIVENMELGAITDFVTDPATLGPPPEKAPDPTLLLAQETIKVDNRKVDIQEAELRLKERELDLKELDIRLDHDAATQRTG